MYTWNPNTSNSSIDEIIRGITWKPFNPIKKIKKKNEKKKKKKKKNKSRYTTIKFCATPQRKSLDNELSKKFSFDCFKYKDVASSTTGYHKKEDRAKGAVALKQYRLAKSLYIQAAMHRLWHCKKFCCHCEDHGHKQARISCLYQAKLLLEKI
tara:strand:+ start:754 stop:1212 length:459 start_codon:yes stop_codon:yes gene_type:complete